MQPSKFVASKTIRKIEKPRRPKWLTGISAQPQGAQQPLSPTQQPRHQDFADDVLQRLAVLVQSLIEENIDLTTATDILTVCHDLKTVGPIIELRNAVQLDRFFVELRNAAGNEQFDSLCRLRLLEVIELRSMGWKSNEDFENNYKNKSKEAKSIETYVPPVSQSYHNVPETMAPTHDSARPMQGSSVPTSANATSLSSSTNQTFAAYGPTANLQEVSVLGPGEVMKSSGKYANPIHVPMKNNYKDEVVIRNSDSGKVIPGAKDRLVQLTGPTENAIEIGKSLIEDTIRRNVSPIREMPNPIQMSKSSVNLTMDRGEHFDRDTRLLSHSLSMNDANIGEYQYTVAVGHDSLKLSGLRLDLVQIAKLVLEEYFAGDAKRTSYEIGDRDIDEDDEDDSLESLTEPPSLEKIELPLNGSADVKVKPIVDQNKPTLVAERVVRAEQTVSIVYDRNELLYYANSPYSRATPKDLPKIILEMPIILKKSPKFFNPDEFKKCDVIYEYHDGQ